MVNQKQVAHRALAVLRKYSSSLDPEIFKREWTTDGRKIEPGDPEYRERCAICGATGPHGSLNYNIIIDNTVTRHRLSVGADCAGHWTLMDGAADEADSKRFIREQMRVSERRREQLTMLPKIASILPKLISAGLHPRPGEARALAALARAWLGERWQHVHDQGKVTAFLTDILGQAPTIAESQYLRTHLLNGIDLLHDQRSSRADTGEQEGHWAGTIKGRGKSTKRRMQSSLANSEAYKDPKRIVE